DRKKVRENRSSRSTSCGRYAGSERVRRPEGASSLKYANATPGSASPASTRYHSKRPLRLEDQAAASVLLPAPGSAAIQVTPRCVASSRSRFRRRRGNQFDARGGDSFARRDEAATTLDTRENVRWHDLRCVLAT